MPFMTKKTAPHGPGRPTAPKIQPRPEEHQEELAEARSVDRRSFLRRGSGLAFGVVATEALVGRAFEIRVAHAADDAAKASKNGANAAANATKAAKSDAKAAPPAKPVTIGVIGLGDQGRALLGNLVRLPGANIKIVCDTFDQIHKRALDIAKGATAVTEYRKVLDDKSVQAVFVATPSHLHKDIAIAALQLVVVVCAN